MHYILIRGPSYRGLDFEERERIREGLRRRLEEHGVRFVQYDWVWDEDDRCLLVAGQYERLDDSRYWMMALETMGFEIIIRQNLPGSDQGE